LGKEITFLLLAWGEKGKREKKEGEKRGNGEAGKRRPERMDGEKGDFYLDLSEVRFINNWFPRSSCI
jgi:hypothetical protein